MQIDEHSVVVQHQLDLSVAASKRITAVVAHYTDPSFTVAAHAHP